MNSADLGTLPIDNHPAADVDFILSTEYCVQYRLMLRCVPIRRPLYTNCLCANGDISKDGAGLQWVCTWAGQGPILSAGDRSRGDRTWANCKSRQDVDMSVSYSKKYILVEKAADRSMDPIDSLFSENSTPYHYSGEISKRQHSKQHGFKFYPPLFFLRFTHSTTISNQIFCYFWQKKNAWALKDGRMQGPYFKHTRLRPPQKTWYRL